MLPERSDDFLAKVIACYEIREVAGFTEELTKVLAELVAEVGVGDDGYAATWGLELLA
jgi:hypothetical protein